MQLRVLLMPQVTLASWTPCSASTQRWAILDKHMDITHWRCGLWQVGKAKCWATEISGSCSDREPVIKTEAQSLPQEVGSYCFSFGVVWHAVPTYGQPDAVSQYACGCCSQSSQEERGLCNSRATGFMTAQMSPKDICEDRNVEAIPQQKRLRSTKRPFLYESFDEPLSDALKKLEVTFFRNLSYLV